MFGIPVWFLIVVGVISIVWYLYILATDIYRTRLYVPESIEWECHECYGWRQHLGQCPFYADCEF